MADTHSKETRSITCRVLEEGRLCPQPNLMGGDVARQQ